MEGIINVNKPKGITSFDVIRRLRKILSTRKIGHTGTLDPMAEGVLLVCVGKATKLAQDIEASSKEYVAEFELGYKTDTYDIEGVVTDRKEDFLVSETELCEVMEKFIGDIEQIPPMYSAIKINGQKLYDLARKGETIERAPRKIRIENIELLEFGDIEQIPPMYSAIKINGQKLYDLARKGETIERAPRKIRIENIELLEFDGKKAKIKCSVSKGTYIRSLIYDIGEELKTFAVMTSLVRVRVGGETLEKSFTLEEIEKIMISGELSFISTVENYFVCPDIEITGEKNKTLFLNGNTLIFNKNDGMYRVYWEKSFLGLAQIKNNRLKGYKYY